jgi:hypothetical protein
MYVCMCVCVCVCVRVCVCAHTPAAAKARGRPAVGVARQKKTAGLIALLKLGGTILGAVGRRGDAHGFDMQ